VDYIAVGFWPVFNVADVAIVGGVFLALGAAG
jgi:lipoprotein signal peptidase